MLPAQNNIAQLDGRLTGQLGSLRTSLLSEVQRLRDQTDAANVDLGVRLDEEIKAIQARPTL